MKKIGLIGGLGPEATIEYYKGLIDAFKNEKANLVYPEIIIYSVNMSEFIEMMREKKYDQAVDRVVSVAESLFRAGADFAAMTANTPHMLFDRISRLSPLPLLSIVEETLKECLKKGYQRPGLMGTGFTMNSTFYNDLFRNSGIDVILPGEVDKQVIDNKLFSEIEIGIFRDDTREQLIEIITKMKNENGIDSVILGCTELPLILPLHDYADIPVLDTTKIHVTAIARYCREE